MCNSKQIMLCQNTRHTAYCDSRSPFPQKYGIVPSNLWNAPQFSRHFILISCDNSFSLYLHKL